MPLIMILNIVRYRFHIDIILPLRDSVLQRLSVKWDKSFLGCWYTFRGPWRRWCGKRANVTLEWLPSPLPFPIVYTLKPPLFLTIFYSLCSFVHLQHPQMISLYSLYLLMLLVVKNTGIRNSVLDLSCHLLLMISETYRVKSCLLTSVAHVKWRNTTISLCSCGTRTTHHLLISSFLPSLCPMVSWFSSYLNFLEHPTQLTPCSLDSPPWDSSATLSPFSSYPSDCSVSPSLFFFLTSSKYKDPQRFCSLPQPLPPSPSACMMSDT